MDILKFMIENDKIESLDDIRSVVAGTTLTKDMGMNYATFLHKIKHPEEFKITEIIRLAALIDIHPRFLTEIIFRQPKV